MALFLSGTGWGIPPHPNPLPKEERGPIVPIWMLLPQWNNHNIINNLQRLPVRLKIDEAFP